MPSRGNRDIVYPNAMIQAAAGQLQTRAVVTVFSSSPSQPANSKHVTNPARNKWCMEKFENVNHNSDMLFKSYDWDHELKRTGWKYVNYWRLSTLRGDII